jgi:hypothetical protein
MKIHTDYLTYIDLCDALRVAGLPELYLEHTAHGSRSRHHAFNVNLSSDAGRDRNGRKRRLENSGQYGAGYNFAATYDEWGYWLAELFERDPDMTATYYKSREDFHAQTGGKYRVEVPA